jgi:oligopeptide/dipeptide ABC transporter ATP-binding protein
MRLLKSPPARISARALTFEGIDVLGISARGMRHIRGKKIGMVFQEPMTSLNPVFTCGSQIVEAIRLHQRVSAAQARTRAIEILGSVGIPSPQQRFYEYPHELSGGMRQRVMIAMALSCNPQLLIADEPTTALDVTIQAQILQLLKSLQHSRGLSILLITHDLSVVAQVAERVAVMYASRIVEYATCQELYTRPLHPYTEALFGLLPQIERPVDRFTTIPGSVPDPLALPSGCAFHPRCMLTRARASEAHKGGEVATIEYEGETIQVLRRCMQQRPPLEEKTSGHWCACWEREEPHV